MLRTFLMILMMAGLVTACDGGSGQPAVGMTITPADGTTGVEVNTVITALFDDDMFAKSIDGSGFVLQDIAGAVDANVSYDVASRTASLTPTTELGLSRQYSVSLNASITDLSGNAISNTSSGFTTREGSWDIASLIGQDNPNMYLPKIAFDKQNNAMAVWVEDTLKTLVFARYDAATKTWGTSSPVGNTTSQIGDVNFSVNGKGNAIVSWYETNGTLFEVYARVYTASTASWGVTKLLASSTTTYPTQPKVAMDENDKAIVIWRQFESPTIFNVYASRYSAGSWSSSPIPLNNNGVRTNFHSIDTDAAGNMTVVWNNVVNDIYINQYNIATNSWSGASLFESPLGKTDYGPPALVVADNGNAIVAWLSHPYIYARHYDASLKIWGANKLVSTENSFLLLKVAMDESGNAIVAWTDADESTNYYVVEGSHYDAASQTWSARQDISSRTVIYDTDELNVVMDVAGNAMVSWREDVTDFIARRYQALSDSWGPITPIESYTGSFQDGNLAVDSKGKVFAVWAQRNGSTSNIGFNQFK